MSRQDKIVRWSDAKNAVLKQERGIGFEVIEALIEDDEILDIIAHPTRPHQKLFLFEIEDYVISVPCIETGGEIFLKTLFKSRKLNKKYKRGK